MEQIWETENRALTLNVSIKCSGKGLFRVTAQDSKPFSFYANRQIIVDGYRTINLSFPVTPKKLKINVEDVSNGKFEKSDFIVKIEEDTLKTYDTTINSETKHFLQLAVYFSQVCGFERPNAN